MASMEKIIRPHLPPNIKPPEREPDCQDPPENEVVKLNQGTMTITPQVETATYSGSWRYYMTRREKEKKKAAGTGSAPSAAENIPPVPEPATGPVGSAGERPPQNPPGGP